MRADTPVGLFLGIFACLLLIAAAVELLKYFINRSRVELLKEVKGLEVQLLEIKEQLRAQAPSSFGSPLAPREVPK